MRKHKFFTGQPVFSQLLSLIPDSLIAPLASRHKSNRYYKKFLAREHLVTMLYQGYFQCTSLRELITGLQANAERLRHLGLTHTPRRSTVADANSHRDAVFFESVFHGLYRHLYKSLPDSRSKKERLFIIDSTTISLFSDVMKGTGTAKDNGRKKGGVKAHVLMDACHDLPAFVNITPAKANDITFLKQVRLPANSVVVADKAYTHYSTFKTWDEQGITWVTRQKRDASFTVQQQREVSAYQKAAGVLSDELILMGRYSNKHITPQIQARRVVYQDQEKKRVFEFISNDLNGEPSRIAAYYKQRWQVELLFKRIKQRYPLRYFLGDNENAIRIQIWTMLICDLLVQYIRDRVNSNSKRSWSYANLAGMIKHHLMTYIQLVPFLQNPEKALLGYKPPDQERQLKLL